jgi:hypothetical protein
MTDTIPLFQAEFCGGDWAGQMRTLNHTNGIFLVLSSSGAIEIKGGNRGALLTCSQTQTFDQNLRLLQSW